MAKVNGVQWYRVSVSGVQWYRVSGGGSREVYAKSKRRIHPKDEYWKGVKATEQHEVVYKPLRNRWCSLRYSGVNCTSNTRDTI